MSFTYNRRPYYLNDLKNMSNTDILNKCSGIIVNKESILENTKLFISLSNVTRINNIIVSDYESALIVNELKNKDLITKDSIYLLDDMELKDRSYIDTTLFKKIKLVIPNTYVMWNVKYDEKIYAYQYLYKNNLPGSDVFSGYYDKETITEIERIASMIKDFSSNLTDVEKIILVSNYLQMYGEYKNIDNKTKLTEEELGNPKTLLLNNIGVCRTFSDATTLLLNNPYLRLNVRNVRSNLNKNGEIHVWNTVLLDGKLYQIDNSRAVSRGEARLDNKLKQTKFNIDYLLFGEKYSRKINHEEISSSINLKYPLSLENFDRKYIETAIDFLNNTGMVCFDYNSKRR